MEFELIRLMTERYGPFKAARIGPGDDCAVLECPEGRVLLFAVDTLVDGVHFELARLGWRALGELAIAVNLSDIAAMAGDPLAAVVSCAFPADVTASQAREFAEGTASCASRWGLELVGGDTVRSPVLTVTVAVLGSCPPERLCLRSAAKCGDGLYVTGTLGGREAARRGGEHIPVTPRLREAQALAEAGVRCMIDISDGVAGDLRHILASSGVGAVVEAAAVPVDPRATKAASKAGLDPLTFALCAGDDYELLFTAPKPLADALAALERKLAVPLTRIGEITEAPATAGPAALLRAADGSLRPLTEGGWNHFR